MILTQEFPGNHSSKEKPDKLPQKSRGNAPIPQEFSSLTHKNNLQSDIVMFLTIVLQELVWFSYSRYFTETLMRAKGMVS